MNPSDPGADGHQGSRDASTQVPGTEHLELETVTRRGRALVQEVGRAVKGKGPVLLEIVAAMLSRGHVLLEDVPGVAKTLTARSIAQVTGSAFKRVQFTPDLLPTDVTGAYIYKQQKGSFRFRPGPLFANLVLGDEINRAPPKTQAALLEAMEERQVTVEGTTHELPTPFTVLATQNPIEQEGTYPLPEAQLDRFMLQTSLGYPSRKVEIGIVRDRRDRGADEVALRRLLDPGTLVQMQASVERVRVDDTLIEYLVEIVARTREDDRLELGASPRATLHVFKLARARAALAGRGYVIPDDIRALAPSALAHRVRLDPDHRLGEVHARQVIAEVVGEVPVPAT